MKRGATNYLSSGASKAFHAVYGMDKVNFIATYSFTEADLDTRNAIKKYMPKFERIYVLFWGKVRARSVRCHFAAVLFPRPPKSRADLVVRTVASRK